MKSQGIYKRDLKHGVFTTWDEDGNVISKNSYYSDKIVEQKR